MLSSKFCKKGNDGWVGSWTKSQFGLTMWEILMSLLTPSTRDRGRCIRTLYATCSFTPDTVEISANVTCGNLFSGNFCLTILSAILIPSTLPCIEQILWSPSQGWSLTYMPTFAFVRILCKKLPWRPINLPTRCCGTAKSYVVGAVLSFLHPLILPPVWGNKNLESLSLSKSHEIIVH